MSDNDEMPLVLIEDFQLGHEKLNQQLEAYVYEDMKQKEELRKNEQRSNIGGWQSERDLHTKLSQETPVGVLLLKLFDSFSNPITQYIKDTCAQANIKPSSRYDWNYTGAWFNVSTKGSYNAPHTHPFSQISAAYYIRTEDPTPEYPFSGRIDFIYENREKHFFPKPGTLILFPGNLLHFVHPYYGSGYRISLSFNLNNIHGVES